jgi:hypothetical protein
MRHTLLRLLALSLAPATVVCLEKADDDDDTSEPEHGTGGRDDTGGAESWGVQCEDATTTLAAGEASALGFSGEDVLAVVAGPTSLDAEWTDSGTTTAVTLALTLTGSPVFHDQTEIVDTGGYGVGADPEGGWCPDYLEVPVTIQFSTADGAFAETLSGAIQATSTDSLSAGGELDYANLGGSYTLTEIDPAEWDDVSLSLNNAWSDGQVRGAVSLSATRELGGGVGEGLVGDVLRWPGSGSSGGEAGGDER